MGEQWAVQDSAESALENRGEGEAQTNAVMSPGVLYWASDSSVGQGHGSPGTRSEDNANMPAQRTMLTCPRPAPDSHFQAVVGQKDMGEQIMPIMAEGRRPGVTGPVHDLWTRVPCSC